MAYKNDIEIEVVGSLFIKMGLNQHIAYKLEARDRNGITKFTRRFTEHMVFRRVLVKMWPGIFIPVLPNKTLIGSSEEEVIRSRSKYLAHFWRALTAYEQIYYSEEVQLFITAGDNVNIEATFQKIEIPDSLELLERYKNVFGEAYSTSQLPEFMVVLLAFSIAKTPSPSNCKNMKITMFRRSMTWYSGRTPSVASPMLSPSISGQ